ncbi:MAG: CehA/McbA family metallohydrolase [Methanocellales archaeon]
MHRFEFHVHSNHSRDGLDSVEKILKQAIVLGLDGIAITDHDTLNGAIEAMEIVKKQNLSILIIPGIEVSTRDGHLIVLGIKEIIPPMLPVRETIRMAREMNGFIIAPHPRALFRNSLWDLQNLDIDAIEVFNPKPFTNAKFAEEIARKHSLPTIAGGDAHSAALIGYAVMEIDCELTERSVLQAIKAGRIKINGKKIPLSLLLKQWSRRFNPKI